MSSLPPEVDVLRRASPFKLLTDDDYEMLCLLAKKRDYAKGDVLFREGEAGGFMVVLTSGTLVAAARGPEGPRELGRVSPGETVGEMAFLDTVRRCATVSAVADSSGYELSHATLDRLKESAPRVANALIAAALKSVATRMRLLEARVGEALPR